jgi:hypothetical protein
MEENELLETTEQVVVEFLHEDIFVRFMIP